MNRGFFIAACFLLTLGLNHSFGQDRFEIRPEEIILHTDADSILHEGLMLYNLELAKSVATRYMRENHPTKLDGQSIVDCLSYLDDDKFYTVFFESYPEPVVTARIRFDSLPSGDLEILQMTDGTFSSLEKDLLDIYMFSFEKLYLNEDKFFTFYKDVWFNIIPIRNFDGYRVYFMPVSSNPDFIAFGNDYVLFYDSEKKLIDRMQIHKGILKFRNIIEGRKAEYFSHTHVVTDLISVTDICILLLNKEYVGTDRHMVLSDKYITIFDLDKLSITVARNYFWQDKKKSRSRQNRKRNR